MQIPGKLYDYLASARPVIALSANREANHIIESAGAGIAVDHHDLSGLSHAFHTLYERWRLTPQQQHQVTADDYSAAMQAQKVAAIYERVCLAQEEAS